jgi:hypothetical protein
LSPTLGEATTRRDGLTLGHGLEITGAGGGAACRIVPAGGSYTLKLADLASWFIFFNAGNFIRFTGTLSTAGAAINATATLYGLDAWPTMTGRARVTFTRAALADPVTISPAVNQGTFWAGSASVDVAGGTRTAFDVYMRQPGSLQPFQCSVNGGAFDSMHEYPVSDVITGNLNLRIDNAGASPICFRCHSSGQYTNADTITPAPSNLITWGAILT